MPNNILDHKNYTKSLLLKNFKFTPTQDQENLIEKLSKFILSKNKNELFIIKGYAGTGKTSLVKSLVSTLPTLKMKSVLLAPTGRAAKVLSNYTGNRAHTIHRKIYLFVTSPSGNSKFIKMKNKHKNTIFIIDEASMIANQNYDKSNVYGQMHLLDDLLTYVYSGENCKLIFIGDTAQLPPVGLSVSPALDEEYLAMSYSYDFEVMELKQVVRQTQESGILLNATNIREQIPEEEFVNDIKPKFVLEGFKDIVNVTGEYLEEMLNDAYSSTELENTIVICRSNKRANIYNQQIRNRILYRDEEICTGDHLMVVKNNYFWLSEESKAGFIANGDIIEIQKIRTIKEIHGFRFADITFRMVDYPDEPSVDAWIVLDTIMSESPCLSFKDGNKLYQSVMEDYSEYKNKSTRYQKTKKDPYFNALQVKFAYAVTCHKAQGGQWEHVFVDQGYLTEDMIDKDYLRWLYTALSRATDKLYLINFRKDFFSVDYDSF